MNTKIFLVSLSFGLGLGTTQMYTENPAALLVNFIAQGHVLNHVTISNAK